MSARLHHIPARGDTVWLQLANRYFPVHSSSSSRLSWWIFPLGKGCGTRLRRVSANENMRRSTCSKMTRCHFNQRFRIIIISRRSFSMQVFSMKVSGAGFGLYGGSLNILFSVWRFFSAEFFMILEILAVVLLIFTSLFLFMKLKARLLLLSTGLTSQESPVYWGGQEQSSTLFPGPPVPVLVASSRPTSPRLSRWLCVKYKARILRPDRPARTIISSSLDTGLLVPAWRQFPCRRQRSYWGTNSKKYVFFLLVHFSFI